MNAINFEKFLMPERTGKFALEKKKSTAGKTVTLVFCGLFIGFINGLFGAGGGMLAVPLLTMVAGLVAKRAHATAILVILPLCAVSSVVYLAKGIDGGDAFIPTIIGVIAGGVLGAFALKKCSNVFLQMLFYGVMFLAGMKMIF